MPGLGAGRSVAAVTETKRMSIVVVGAGLAGLATAAAFSRAGHEVAVLEQANALRAGGLAGALSRRPSPASRLTPPVMSARMTARSGGPVLRRVTRPALPFSTADLSPRDATGLHSDRPA